MVTIRCPRFIYLMASRQYAIQANGLSNLPGEKFTGCWLIKTVRWPNENDAKVRSINQNAKRRITAVTTKKIRNNCSLARKMNQKMDEYPSEPNQAAEM